ncbi:hypothetical protein E3E35_08375 [Thermococcus sp. GR7]|uniref:hypothetical protein n=1 Tax=unclassified Thermococcus TaxID=2627626 RepID=UPI0014305237|nr:MULTISPECIES: hypothetical protein [unclassified Thermococcus]NJE47413.1 hypothetical protein [Thermococcus sp. GR7]NJE79471.1 hypothetical protein [Thermococcus sp. GR4]NJF23463.1 hypothetical protein [Thermococcus sp. GR5]
MAEMRLMRDLSVLFAMLTSLTLILWVQPEERGNATFLFATALIVLVFLLLVLTMKVERLESKVAKLESSLKKFEERGFEGDSLER